MTASPTYGACANDCNDEAIEECPPTQRPRIDLSALAKEAEAEADNTLVMPAAWLESLRVQSRPERPRWSKPAAPLRVEVVELDPDEIVVVDDEACDRASDEPPPRDSGVVAIDVDIDLDHAFDALKSA